MISDRVGDQEVSRMVYWTIRPITETFAPIQVGKAPRVLERVHCQAAGRGQHHTYIARVEHGRLDVDVAPVLRWHQLDRRMLLVMQVPNLQLQLSLLSKWRLLRE